jgi:hypothetical protein
MAECHEYGYRAVCITARTFRASGASGASFKNTSK